MPRTIGPGVGLAGRSVRAGNDRGEGGGVDAMGSGPGAGARALGAARRAGGALGGGPGRALTVGLPGQLLHNLGLQLAVRFPHPRRPRPLPPGRTRRGAQQERIGQARAGAAGAGRAEAGGRAGPGPGRAFVCAEPARPGLGAPRPAAPRGPGRRAGTGASAAAGQAGPWAAALSGRRGAGCAGLGWAPTRPRCSGRPWLLGSAAHARCCAACAAARLPRLPPHRRARGGPRAATQRWRHLPPPHPPPPRACAREPRPREHRVPAMEGLLSPRRVPGRKREATPPPPLINLGRSSHHHLPLFLPPPSHTHPKEPGGVGPKDLP